MVRIAQGWGYAALALLIPAAFVAACSGDDETNGQQTATSVTGGSGGAGGAGGMGGAPYVEPIVLLPRTSLQADELAVVVNDQDPQSIAVGDYYIQARSIPQANLITLSFDTATVLSPTEFDTIKQQLDAALPPNIQALALTWVSPYRVGCMSITSAFALGFSNIYCNTSGQSCGETAPVDYYNSDSFLPFDDHNIRPTMSIAAETLGEAQALIDRGVAADDTYPAGDGYFIRTTDAARSVRWQGMQAVAGNWDYPEGLALTYLDNSQGNGSNFVENTADVLFYFTGLTTVPQLDTNTYLPGAIADHLTSFGGRLTDSSQMSVLRWLEAGATASYGTTMEPCNYLQKFPNLGHLLSHYFRGETLIEAYWKSVAWPGEGIFVGEPLARPWGSSQVEVVDGNIVVTTTLLDPRKTYQIGHADSEDGPFELYIDNVGVGQHARLSMEFGHVNKRYYKLAETGAL
jgi:uncharacterized protein (TIGR03790 family)